MGKGHEVKKRKSSINKSEKTMQRVAGRFPLSDRLINIPLTPKQEERMKTYSLTLSIVPSDVNSYSLKQWQSPVKDQSGRGSCSTFSFLGAIEARYRRDYGLAVDLSAEYFINVVFSTQPSCDPFLRHENICNDYLSQSENPNPPPDSGMTDGVPLMTAEKILIPEMRFCPYFGNEHANDPPVYGIGHSDIDLDQIAADAGLINLYPPGAQPQWDVIVPYTQRAVDNYYYDFRHIPLDARKNARYGAEEVEYVTPNDPAIFESCIYSSNEVVIGLTLDNLTWGDGVVYLDQTPVQFLDCGDGTMAPIAQYPIQNVNIGVAGHSMIAVAWDKSRQLILLKNSWGTDSPYVWVPYQYIRERCDSAFIVTKVRDPQYNNWSEYPIIHASEPYKPSDEWDHLYEAMWLGRWRMDNNGFLGELVIRHTRARGQGPGTVCRLGSYYDGQGIAHTVTGYIKAEQDLYFTPPAFSGPAYSDPCKSYAHLWIDFENPEGPPDPANMAVICKGQEVKLQMFPHPIGSIQGFEAELAVGETTSNGVKCGVILFRPGKEIGYTPGEFSIDRWNGQYLFLQGHWYMALPGLIQINVNETPKSGVYFASIIGGSDCYGMGTIHQDSPNRMDIELSIKGYGPTILHCPIYFHTGEVGLVSGLGAGIFTQSFYVGNTKTKELHLQSCSWGQLISAKHKSYFFNVNQALQAGYNGCHFCMSQYDTG